jgi:peptide/nickel transport system ATP-binding protein
VESAPVEALFAHPTHPYTSGLLGCVPVPGKVARGAPLGSIAGVVPRLGPEFRGCGFRDRCAHAAPACAQTIARRAAGPRHDYLCRLEPGLAGGAR